MKHQHMNRGSNSNSVNPIRLRLPAVLTKALGIAQQFHHKPEEPPMKDKGIFAATIGAALILASTAAMALSPPNMTKSVKWDEDPGTAGDQQTYTGVAAIQAAFNNGRRQEESQLFLPVNTLGNLSLPSQPDWDGMSLDQKALLIVNAERTARGGVGYATGTPLGLPLEGVEANIDALAQNYANYMVANNFWDHNAPADKPAPFTGTGPFQRIDNDPVIGNGVGTAGGNCHQFLAASENLSIFFGTTDVQLPVERALYGFIYDDGNSAWGHREAVLLQDWKVDGNRGGYNNDVGSAANEGYMGIAIAGATDGLYDPMGRFATSGWTHQLALVFLVFDPTADPQCNYNVINTPPGAVTNLIMPSGTITDTTPTYSWQSVAGATWYFVWEADATGRWYTAEQAGCAADGTCTITSTVALPTGAGTWWVLPYNRHGYGPWSAPQSFVVQTGGTGNL